MLKIELVWRELLFRAIDRQSGTFSITELSQKFKLSTSVVSFALKPLREMQIIQVFKTHSRIIDTEKLLYFWATRRNLSRDIIYETESALPPAEREASMPPGAIATCYSAYCQIFGNPPADYEVIYYYAPDLNEIKKRFPPKKSMYPNLIFLKPDEFLKEYPVLPTAQLFVDLWNAKEWYARDFSNKLFEIIQSKIGG